MKAMLKIMAASAAMMFAACESDTTFATERSPAEDSVLALQVLSARGDTLLPPAESERIVVDVSPTKRILLEPEKPTPPTTVASTTAAPAPSPRPAPPQVTTAAELERKQPSPARQAKPLVASANSAPVVSKPRSTERAGNPEPVEPRARTRGIVSAGSSLSFVADQRVCTSAANAGDTFDAVLLVNVRGSNGAVIPKGARAVAQITSLGEWGAGMGVKLKSVRFNGHTYPLSSDVGYVALERVKSTGSVCIPHRARIDASLRQPLTVVAMN